MKLFFKILGITLGVVLAGLYLAFLFLLPRFDINQFKPEIQKIAQEQAKLGVNFENAKIITTPLLGVGVKADNISVTLPDGSVLFSADGVKGRVALPSLLLLTVKVSCAEVYSPFVNLEIVDNKAFKIVQVIEDILNAQEVVLEETEQAAVTEAPAFNPAWIRIKVPCVKLTDYKVLINDLKSKHYLTLKGEELKLAYLNGKIFKLKTYAEFFSDENKNITANLDINTFIPPAVELDEEDDEAQRVEIPFINPVSMYRNYDLKANADVKIRLRERVKNLVSFGYVNIDGVTLKLSQFQLPESYFHLKTRGFWADIDSNLNLLKDEHIALLGKLNYSRHPKFDMNIKTSEIYFNDMVLLTKALLDSLHIQNDLDKVAMKGFVKADTYIKTNLKKLISNGEIDIKDGALTIKGVGNVISDLKALISLDNNVMEIKDTSLNLAGAKVSARGKIDEKSVADINISSEKVSLPMLFNAFAPDDVKNAFNFKSGDFALNLDLKGKLDNAVAKLGVDLVNLNLSDRARTFVITNNKLNADFACDKKDLTGTVDNADLRISLPIAKSNIALPKFEMNIAEKNVLIPENTLVLNNNSNIIFKGEIKDYIKLSNIDLSAKGKILGTDLIALMGKEFAPFFNTKGQPELSVTVNGNGKKQTLNLNVNTDKDNFFTPINIASLRDKMTALRSTIDFKGNRIKIKDTGLYTRNIVTDDKGNQSTVYNEVVGIDGTIVGNNINLLKITMPETLRVSIQAFKNSMMDVKGHLFVFGDVASPRFRGGYDIKNLTIPDLMMTMENGSLAFKGKELVAKVTNLLVNGSDFAVDTTISLEPASVINITGMDVKSNLVDADKLMKVSEAAMRFVPASPAPASNAAPADIPVTLRNGHFSGRTLKSGAIVTGQTDTDFSLNRNILVLNNLRTRVFDGSVRGNISMNLISTLMQIRVSGDNLDVQKALLQAAAMDNMLYGTAEFSTDISLRGVTYEEQMKTLKGSVDFQVRDGQFGPFGKLENLIIAENIRESEFFQTALGGVIDSLTSIDTTHFMSLIGHLTFDKGIATIDPITSIGDALSLKIFGDMDLLKNTVDMKVRARLTSTIANLLGPLNAINPINIMNSAGGMNVFTAKAFSLFCEAVTQEEMDSIPAFENGYIDFNSTKFQLVVRGDLAKPLTLIKSFKWLALASDVQQAQEFIDTLPVAKDGENYVLNEKFVEKKKEELKKEAQKAVDAKKEELKEELKEAAKAKIEEKTQGKLGNFLKKAKEVKDELDAAGAVE